MSTDLPPSVINFLKRPNPAVMAVVRGDGQPLSVATWYLYAEGAVLVNMLTSRKRLRHLHPGALVSMTVLAEGDWYRHVSLQGRVMRITPDDDYRDADRLSEYYIGSPHTPRDGDRVSVWVDVTAWHGWRISGA